MHILQCMPLSFTVPPHFSLSLFFPLAPWLSLSLTLSYFNAFKSRLPGISFAFHARVRIHHLWLWFYAFLIVLSNSITPFIIDSHQKFVDWLQNGGTAIRMLHIDQGFSKQLHASVKHHVYKQQNDIKEMGGGGG